MLLSAQLPSWPAPRAPLHRQPRGCFQKPCLCGHTEGQGNIKGSLKKRTFSLPPLFIFRKVMSQPTMCNRASPEALTPLLFFTCDYNKSLIPQTDLRTINKYKRKRNISSITKAASEGIEFCDSFTSLSKQSRSPTEKGIQRYENYKNSKRIQFESGSCHFWGDMELGTVLAFYFY